MNDNQTKGFGKAVEGSVKEAAGKAAGDHTTEIKGKIEKNVGIIQKKLGDKQQEHHEKQQSRS